MLMFVMVILVGAALVIAGRIMRESQASVLVTAFGLIIIGIEVASRMPFVG